MAASEGTGDLDENLGALVRGERLAHRPLSRVHRAACLVGPALGHTCDELAGVRRAHLDPFAGLDPLAAEEELPFRDRCRHAASLGN